MSKARHPIQPLVEDEHGKLRFKENKIVSYLLDNGGIDMNDIAILDFPREDREQFAQLIGYSHSGSSGLGYMTDAVWEAAGRMHQLGETEEQARITQQEQTLQNARARVREAACALFRIHPDDLHT